MNSHILVNETINSLPEQLFDRETHGAEATISNAGRGTVIMFRHENQDMVLKSYLRGGLPGRFVVETYLYSGLERTRMWREFHMLREMHEMGLPVPMPIGARCQMKTPITYRGELIMSEIKEASTLSEWVSQSPLPGEVWSSIGETVATFHNSRVFHHDLNANNILITRDHNIYLIDFDKCYFKSGTVSANLRAWQSNIKRLKKSLRKLSASNKTFHFDNEAWDNFDKGYKGRIGSSSNGQR